MIKKLIKIVSFDKLDYYLPLIKNKKKVLVGGCFDLLHYGHIQFLKKAKKTGDFLIILLESDKFIREKKKRNPIHTQRQRAEILAELSLVDLIILLSDIFSYDDYLKIINKIQPIVIAITEKDPQFDNKKKQADKVKAKLKTVSPLIRNFSTRKIIERLHL